MERQQGAADMLRAKCNEKLGRAGYRVAHRARAGGGPKSDRSGTRRQKTREDAQAPAPFRTGDRAPARRAARRRMRGVSGQTRPRAAARSGRRTARWTAGRPENRRPRSPERIHDLRAPAHGRPVRNSPAGTTSRPGFHPGSRRPAGYRGDRMGTVGTGRIVSPGRRVQPQPAGRRRTRLPVWTAAREGRKMACWGR